MCNELLLTVSSKCLSADAALAYVFRAVNAIGPPLPAEQIVAAKHQQPAPAPVRQPAPKRKQSPPGERILCYFFGLFERTLSCVVLLKGTPHQTIIT